MYFDYFIVLHIELDEVARALLLLSGMGSQELSQVWLCVCACVRAHAHICVWSMRNGGPIYSLQIGASPGNVHYSTAGKRMAAI